MPIPKLPENGCPDSFIALLHCNHIGDYEPVFDLVITFDFSQISTLTTTRAPVVLIMEI